MKIKKEVKIAAITIVAIIAFILMLNFLRGKKIFSNENTFYAIFPKIEGLVPSDPVKVNGLQIGSVEDLQFISESDTRIKVEISVSSKVKIPKNSIIQITSANIMGGKFVNIALGNDIEVATDGDILEGSIEGDLLSSIGEQITPIKDKAAKIMDGLDTLLVSVNSIVDKKFGDKIDVTISTLNSSLTHIKSIANNADSLVAYNKVKISNLITNLEAFSQDLKNAEISKATASLNSSLNKLNVVLDSVQNGNGTVGMLIKDKQLYEEITKSADNLKLLLEDIKANPKKYLTIKVF
jgi:phospholipid/cholesterol/gamma-HCH transport system substrate-binding protein